MQLTSQERRVIGVRVATARDKVAVENWLKSDPDNRAIIFHSAAYEPGYSLFMEFPYQVTGQDINPVFIKETNKNDLNQIFDEIRSLWN